MNELELQIHVAKLASIDLGHYQGASLEDSMMRSGVVLARWVRDHGLPMLAVLRKLLNADDDVIRDLQEIGYPLTIDTVLMDETKAVIARATRN